MDLIKCPECGKEISDKANACINCGYPISEYVRELHREQDQNETEQAKENQETYQSESGNQREKTFSSEIRKTNYVAEKAPFWKRWWFLTLMCIFIPPVGICLLWIVKKPKYAPIRTTLTAFLAMYAFVWCIAVFPDSDGSTSANDNGKTEYNVEEKSQSDVGETKQEINENDKTEDDGINNNLKSAIQSIGMDFSDVKNIKSLPDWKSGKRYSFVYNGFSYIVYELDNGEIQSICTEYKRTKIYERGYKPLDYKDFEPESAILTSIEQNAVETASNYIDGETSIKIKFGSQMYDRIYDHYYICGTVKAKTAVSKKNYNFSATYKVDEKNAKCIYFELDGNTAFGEDETPEIKKEELEEQNKNNSEKSSITLSYGKKGEYGQFDSFNEDDYLRYYIPKGKYKVNCIIGGGFYIETIETHKENGSDVSDIISQTTMKSGDISKITISEGECISLIINTEIELTKE